MPVVTATSVPAAPALAVLLLLVPAEGSDGGVAVLVLGLIDDEVAPVDGEVVDGEVIDGEVLDGLVGGVAEVLGGIAGSADVRGVCASAEVAARLTTAAAAKARRLFISMHAPICLPPRPASHNWRGLRRFR
jgi:hypothetical protein